MFANWMARCFVSSLVVGLLGFCSIASAQQDEEPTAEAAYVDQEFQDQEFEDEDGQSQGFQVPGAQGQYYQSQPQSSALRRPAGGVYRSDSLRGEFVGQAMYITMNGRSYPFWGVRAIALDHDSPLRNLHMQVHGGASVPFTVGDVLTRLDNVVLDKGKFMQGNVWQMPELDAHFGATDVRWIKQRHNHVNVGQIVIDNYANGHNHNHHHSAAPVTP